VNERVADVVAWSRTKDRQARSSVRIAFVSVG